MEDYRSKSCKVGTFNKAPTSMQDLRCYSATTYNHNNNDYHYKNNSYQVGDPHHQQKEIKIKKSKSSFGKSASSKSWSFNDPELQRKTRVASYKVYAVEGKMKGSLRKSFKWIKNTYTQMVHGW